MVTEDDDGNVYGGNIGNAGATTPTQIQISNMTLRNTVAYGGCIIGQTRLSAFCQQLSSSMAHMLQVVRTQPTLKRRDSKMNPLHTLC